MCFVCSHIQTLDWGKDYITAYLLRYTTRRTLTILKCSPKKWSEFSTVSLNSHTADVPIMKMFKVKFTFFKGEAICYSSSCTSMAVIYTHFPPDMAYSVSSASRSQPINISIKLKVLIKKKNMLYWYYSRLICLMITRHPELLLLCSYRQSKSHCALLSYAD